jgi:hypothetical protein
MGCYPSSEKITATIVADFDKLYPHELFTDIENEKKKRMENLESLFRKTFDNGDWNDAVFLIEDYVRLDKVKYHYYSYDSLGKVFKRIVKPDTHEFRQIIKGEGMLFPITEKYGNGIQQIISDDEIYALIDKIVKVPHTRKIKVSKYKDCIWKYKVVVKYVVQPGKRSLSLGVPFTPYRDLIGDTIHHLGPREEIHN